MGREAALEAFRRGADVTVVSNTEVHGKIPCVKNISITSASEMAEAVLKQPTPHYYMSAAAISDFAPVCSAEKIHSGKPVSINLTPLPKLITQMSGKGAKIIGFKIGEDAVEAGRRLLAEEDVILVAANYPETMGAKTGEYILLQDGAETPVSGEKDEIARKIWDAVL